MTRFSPLVLAGGALATIGALALAPALQPGSASSAPLPAAPATADSTGAAVDSGRAGGIDTARADAAHAEGSGADQTSRGGGRSGVTSRLSGSELDAAQSRSQAQHLEMAAKNDAVVSAVMARAEAKRKAAEERKKKAADKASAKAQGYDLGVTDPKKMARQIAQNKFGWGATEFACYNKIIMRESMWDPQATNPSSGAFGIPQALPASKMASAGSDWRTNPATQIRWGLGYVKDTYQTPCQAWSFKSAHGWY